MIAGPIDLRQKKKDLLAPFLVVVFLSVALERLTTTVAAPDLWGYLAFWRLYWHSGSFPYQDIFAYLPTLPHWIYHEWLTGVVFYPLFQTLGPAGLQILKFILGLVTVFLVYLTARRLGAEALSAWITLIIIQILLGPGYSPVRAQVFTLAFFTLSLYLLESGRQTRRWRGLWLLVPLQALWCNLHGGFLAGVGLICLYAVGEGLSRRPFLPYAGILVLAGLATLANPYGLEYCRYLLEAVTMPRPEITEWLSVFQAFQLGYNRGYILLFLGYVMLFFFLALWAKWRDLTAILALSLTLYLGLKHIRHQVLFLLLSGAYLPVLLTAFLKEIKADTRILQIIRSLGGKIPVFIAIIVILFNGFMTLKQGPLSIEIPDRPSHADAAEVYYPVKAVAYIKDRNLSGSLLTNFY